MVWASWPMSVEKRKTGTGQIRWTVRWRDPLGAPKQRTFARKEDARAFEAKVIHDRRQGTYRDPKLDRLTVAEWHKTWWPTIADSDLAPGTVSTYESLLRLHVLPTFGPRAMSQINKIDIESWLISKRKDGMAGSSLAKVKSLIGRLFSSAVDSKIIITNPVQGIRLRGTTRTKTQRALTDEEIVTLLEALPAHYRPLATLLGETGLRPGEALALRRRHLEGTKLRIEAALVESHGVLRDGPTKTRRNRTIPLSARAQQAICDALQDRPAGPEVRVFVTEEGSDIWLSNFRRVLRQAVATTDLCPTVTPYTFRHSVATRLAKDAIAPSVAAKYLGHDPKVFLSTYAHIYDEDLGIVAEALDAHAPPA